MIEIKKLNKAFGNNVLFKDYNLNIETGEFIVFNGISGSGKTTLLNMIGGIESIDSGEILVNGIDITKKRNQLNYFRTIVGFLFQNFALIGNKTVYDNMNIVKKHSKNDISIEEALKRVGLEDRIYDKIYKLSGGQQQRIALARLMIKKCDIILADEPTGSLDEKNGDNVIDMLKELNNEGRTIIMVTHNLKYQTIGRNCMISACCS